MGGGSSSKGPTPQPEQPSNLGNNTFLAGIREPEPKKPEGDTLFNYGAMKVNDALVSKNGKYKLVFESDGNLFASDTSLAVWGRATSLVW